MHKHVALYCPCRRLERRCSIRSRTVVATTPVSSCLNALIETLESHTERLTSICAKSRPEFVALANLEANLPLICKSDLPPSAFESTSPVAAHLTMLTTRRLPNNYMPKRMDLGMFDSAGDLDVADFYALT